MLKKIALLLLLTTPAIAVTTADVPAIKSGSMQLLNDAVRLGSFADEIIILSQNAFQFKVGFSTVTVDMTSQQKQDLVARYNTLKANLQADFLALP